MNHANGSNDSIYRHFMPIYGSIRTIFEESGDENDEESTIITGNNSRSTANGRQNRPEKSVGPLADKMKKAAALVKEFKDSSMGKFFGISVLAAVVLSFAAQRNHADDGSGFRITTNDVILENTFPLIHRSDYGDAMENFLDTKFLSKYMMKTPQSSNSTTTTSTKSELSRPIPTGAFWTNLIMNDNGGGRSSFPVVTYPYAFEWNPKTGLAASYPELYRTESRLVISDAFYPDITFAFKEGGGGMERHILEYDDLSVTLRMDSGEEAKFMESYLVQGAPYMTLRYENVTPTLTALGGWLGARCFAGEGGADSCDFADGESWTSITGVRFFLKGEKGQRWILFASDSLTLLLSKDGKTLTSDKSFQGILRLALIPKNSSSNGSTVTEIINGASTYPVGGRVDFDFEPESNHHASSGVSTATISFIYNVKSMQQDKHPKSQILMLALPHQAKSLSPKTNELPNSDGNYNCIKGPMTFVIGDDNQWSYEESLVPTSSTNIFDPTYMASTLASMSSNPVIFKEIKRNIHKDKSIVLPTATDVYGFGKEIARMAQVALLADIAQIDNKDILAIVHDGLMSFLDGDSDAFVYDLDLGGVVTKNGLLDPNADFGNGRYNDHHFHYGYFIYASSILSYYNSTFYQKCHSRIQLLVADVSNPPLNSSHLKSSPLFPTSRHKSWYDGHSWASGLFPQSNGKSQESSSEAVNCYYAVYLWNVIKTSHYSSQQDAHSVAEGYKYSRLLLATELHGAQTYWHTGPSSELYTLKFRSNYMVGNMGMLDVTSTTWFGTKMVYVHLINFMPVTAITAYLFDKEYVKGEYRDVLEDLWEDTGVAWRGYLVADQAIVDPTGAWEKALKLPSYELDSGLSKSQLLFWINGRGTVLNATGIVGACEDNEGCEGLQGMCCPNPDGVYLGCCDSPVSDDVHENSPQESGSVGTCESSLGCFAMGLTGLCCPASNGVYLGCCGNTPDPNGNSSYAPVKHVTTTLPANNSGSASCGANPGCASTGLVGDCCPAPGGVFLGCCGSSGKQQENNISPSKNKNITSEANEVITSSSDASCNSSPGCASTGLVGDCCPAPGGVFLGCCGSSGKQQEDNISPSKNKNITSEANEAITSSSDASCNASPGCASTGLVGDCCPTPGGVFLGCCGSSGKQQENNKNLGPSTKTDSIDGSQTTTNLVQR